MPHLKTAFAALVFGAILGTVASAQESSGNAQHGGSASYPEACKKAGGAAAPAETAPHTGMDLSSMQEHQRDGMEGMMKMDRDMMQGMMAADPDVAFICGMIAHHQGAIDMAKVELEHGDNQQAKEMAQKVIDAQTQEIAEMTKWLEENAK